MKIKFPDDDLDLNEDEITGERDSLDKYNEEMARDAVGSLFDDDDEEEDTEEERPVVTGFGRTARKPRERAPMARVTPTPRPAVRVAPPAAKERRTRPPVSSRYIDDDDYDYDESGIEDEMEAFRKYKKPSKESRTRSDVPRRAGGERVPVVRNTRSNYEAADDNYEDERIPALHWVFIGVTVVLLVTSVFFAYRTFILTDDLNEANALLDEAPETTKINDAVITQEQMSSRIDEQDAEIARLQGIIDNNEAAGDEPTFGPDDTDESGGLTNPVMSDDEPGQDSPLEEQTYSVVSGDNFSKIAIKFFGSATPAVIQKIKDANGLTSDMLQLGQELIIPAE